MQQVIYNQHHIPERQWRYGFRASKHIGCAWIAVYNALCILGIPAEIPVIIRRLERQLPLINGSIGTFLGSPAWLLHSMGCRVRLLNRRKEYDEAAKKSPVCLLSYYWRNGARVGAHIIALRWADGEFIGYNTFRNSNGPDHLGPSIEAFLQKRKYFGSILTLVEPGKNEKPTLE